LRATDRRQREDRAELKNVIVKESEATFIDLAVGTAIKVTVSSRNSKGGESAPSAPATATVP
jgi:hypothetical protein